MVKQNLEFITKSKSSMFIFRILTVVFVFLGSIASLGLVWDMADVFMGVMALMNYYSYSNTFSKSCGYY